MTLEEARDYCVEIDLPGKEYGWHDAAYVNTPKWPPAPTPWPPSSS